MAQALYLPHIHTAEHTLGVFALIAHFRPGDYVLRAAVLLHDIGHFSFSHTLEGLPGIDHHAVTRARLQGPEIAPLLREHGVTLTEVTSLLSGSTPSLLRNQTGALQADHLDSWVRGAQARGQLTQPPPDVLRCLHVVGDYLETDIDTAEGLVKLIVAEACFHASAANLGGSAVLEQLVSSLLNAGELDIDALSEMTDAELTSQLFASPLTVAEARRLWFDPERLHLMKTPSETSGDGLRVRKEKLYLSLPRAQGQLVDTPKVRTLLELAASLRGEYIVLWHS